MLKMDRLTAPSIDPISVQDIKDQLRIDHDDEDALIQFHIKAAISHLDGWYGSLRRCIINQQWQLETTKDVTCVEVPLPILQSVDRVAVYDDDAKIWTDLTSDQYLVYGETVTPTATSRKRMQVVFTAGFGSTLDSVPESLRMAILFLAAHFFTHRDMVAARNMFEVPATFDRMFQPFKIPYIEHLN